MSDSSSYQFKLSGRQLELKRYPFNQKSQLRAWDAADEYLLSALAEADLAENELPEADLPEDSPCWDKVLVLHDNFGCLSLALAERATLSYSDSWMALQALKLNAQANGIKTYPAPISSVSELCNKAAGATLIIGRVPKNKAQLAYLLASLSPVVADNCELWLAGMDKHLSRGQYELLARHFGPPRFLPGVKKARIWRATRSSENRAEKADSFKRDSIELPSFGLRLNALPNVFCASQLDIGTRFLLEAYQRLPDAEKVADLACGNGVLGLAYLAQHPDACVSFFDESFQAIESVKHNLATNFPTVYDSSADDPDASVEPAMTNTKHEAVAGDGLKACPADHFDLVLCNPPFHQQTTLSTELAASLFRDARRCLQTGGEFWVVANRHLGYHQVLKRLFGHCETVVGNKKFVILKAVKP